MKIKHTNTKVMQGYYVAINSWSDIDFTTMIHKFSELIRCNQADEINFIVYQNFSNSIWTFKFTQKIHYFCESKTSTKDYKYKIYYKDDNIYIPIMSSFDMQVIVKSIKRKMKVTESEEK